MWFAPNSLKKLVQSTDEIKGCYVPFWCFDSNSKTTYSGQSGEHYYETKTRTVNGKSETYLEQKTRWHNVSGSVNCSFKNELELAQTILPHSLVDDLNNWNLEKSKKFNKDFTLGYQSLFSNIKVDSAWKRFINHANQKIESKIKEDIGGDEQNINSKDVRHVS